VSPFRALLAAHGQATWNQSAKELGKQGHLILVGVVGFLSVLAALGLILGCAVLGWVIGSNLERPAVALAFSALLTFLGVGGGLMSGVLGGTRQLAWESYRGFPLRLRTLYGAELLAGLGDLLPLVLVSSLAGLLLGLGAAVPRTLLLLPLVFLETVLTLLVLQLLVGSLAGLFVKRLRLALMGLGLVAWLASMAVSGPLIKGAEKGARPVAPQAAQAARIQALGQNLGRALRLMPAHASVESLVQAQAGKPGRALLAHLYPLALVGLLMALGLRLLAAETDGAAAPTAPSGPERLWSFRQPAEGLGRLHFQILMRSHLGRFAFLMPLLTLVLLKGPFAQLKGNPLWSVPLAFAYLSMVGNNFAFNQFGLDRHGVKALLLLPVSSEQLLKGKLLGMAAHQGCQALLLMLLLAAFDHAGPAPLLGGLLLMACIFLAQTALGQWTSTWAPRPMSMTTLQNNNLPFVLGLLSIAASGLWTSVFGGAYALLAWGSPRLLVPGMAVVFGLTLAAHLLLLPKAAGALDRRREKLVEALG
jgi:hypothetical protein